MNTFKANYFRRLLAITFLSALVAMTACDQKGPAEKAGQKIDQVTEKAGKDLENAKTSVAKDATTAGNYMDDAMITAKVKETLVADDLLKATQIEVTTVDGVVKLNGILSSEQLIGRAITLVTSQKYVKSVVNELQFSAGEVAK
ncbi:BON domain-containing protein [Methylomonas sp. AM2-LC]|uniref:BON domain-containing protein n=1 Tax=Methylomonas sp. AM2-LC TaxID=3153301 RepID=UPI003267488D